jgi:hypothetical protein
MTTPINDKPTYVVEERVASAYTGVGASEPSGTMPAGSAGLETALVRFRCWVWGKGGWGRGNLSGGSGGAWLRGSPQRCQV